VHGLRWFLVSWGRILVGRVSPANVINLNFDIRWVLFTGVFANISVELFEFDFYFSVVIETPLPSPPGGVVEVRNTLCVEWTVGI
jgi:hypothetical protein